MQVSSVEIERVCVQHVHAVSQAAAVSVTPASGGPEQLHLFLVPASSSAGDDPGQLLQVCQKAVQRHLNPLFKVQGITVCTTLPRNATNKVLRRLLRDQLAARHREARL